MSATLSTTEIEADQYRLARVRHWNAATARPRRGGRAYHRRLEQIYRFLVAPGQRVLEVGSATGDLLAAVRPATGVGVDFSDVALARGRERHPGLRFVEADAHDLSSLSGTFDVIILSDLLNDLWDVQGALTGLRRLCHPGTRQIGCGTEGVCVEGHSSDDVTFERTLAAAPDLNARLFRQTGRGKGDAMRLGFA